MKRSTFIRSWVGLSAVTSTRLHENPTKFQNISFDVSGSSLCHFKVCYDSTVPYVRPGARTKVSNRPYGPNQKQTRTTRGSACMRRHTYSARPLSKASMDHDGKVQDLDLVRSPLPCMFTVSSTSPLLLVLVIIMVVATSILIYLFLRRSWGSVRARTFSLSSVWPSLFPSPDCALPIWFGLLAGHTLRGQPAKAKLQAITAL